jgi:hypothetical protein
MRSSHERGARVTTSEITREIEKNGVCCWPDTHMAMPDVLGKRRWFACGEPTKEADDLME